MKLRWPGPLSTILTAVVKASLVGNAVLLVLLGGASNAGETPPKYPLIHPHRPVHLTEDFDFLIDARYNLLAQEAVKAWNVAVNGTVVSWFVTPGAPEIDALFFDLAEGGVKQIEYTNHNGDTPSFTFTFECPCAGATASVAHEDDAEGEPFMFVVYNATSGFVAASDDANVERTFTHEIGHLLSLKDHDNEDDDFQPYTGMMDGTCALNACDDPGDYEILNFTAEDLDEFPILFLYPDEASCVRELFKMFPGRQGCAP